MFFVHRNRSDEKLESVDTSYLDCFYFVCRLVVGMKSQELLKGEKNG